MSTRDASCPATHRPEGWTDRLPDLADLVQRLDRAVEAESFAAIVAAVEQELSASIAAGAELTPAAFLDPVADHYARRLLHPDPAGRYTVICMTWGPGQGTPLHDHGDSWGTVGVYRGRVRATPYSLRGETDDGLWHFLPGGGIDAGVGTAASVIPPVDHHTIENPFDHTAVSVHVYRGRMETCGIYLPTDRPDHYRRELKTLAFDDAAHAQPR